MPADMLEVRPRGHVYAYTLRNTVTQANTQNAGLTIAEVHRGGSLKH